MPKASVEVDRDIAREAAAIRGTTTLRATIAASLREVVSNRAIAVALGVSSHSLQANCANRERMMLVAVTGEINRPRVHRGS